MEIRQLFIDGFGHFNNVELDDLSGGLVLFLGDNEAGKSTLLGFVRAMFFGFPDGRSSENLYEPLNGGQHGGHLLVNTESRGQMKIERMKGKDRGAAQLLFLKDSMSGNNSDLNTVLGGLSKSVFNNVFAFSLGELQTFESLNNDDVEGALYGAGSGVSLMAIPRSLKKLDQDMGRLYKKGGSNPAINAKLANLQDIQKKHRDAILDIKAFENLSEQSQELTESIKQLQEAKERQKKDQSRIKDFLRLWDQWINLQEEEESLNDLPEIVSDFPDDGSNRLMTLENSLESLERNRKKELDKKDVYQTKIQALSINQLVLSQEKNIHQLYEDLGTYSTALIEREDGIGEIESINSEIKRHLENLGKSWTEEKITSMDRSLFTQNNARQHQSSLAEASTDVKQAENHLLGVQEELKESIDDEKTTEKDLKKYPDPETEQDESVIQAIQNGRDKFAAAITDLPKRRNELINQTNELDKSIKEIDPSWDQRTAENFDCPMVAREKIERFEIDLDNLAGEIKELSHRIDMETDALEDLSNELEKSRENLKSMPLPSLENKDQYKAKKDQLLSIQECLIKKERIQDVIKNTRERITDIKDSRRQSEPDSLSWVLKFSKIIGVIVALAGLLTLGGSLLDLLPFEGTLPGAFLLVIGILFLVVGLMMEKKQARADSRSQEIYETKINALIAKLKNHENEIVAVEDELNELSVTLGVSSATYTTELKALGQQLEADLTKLEKRAEALREIEQIEKNESKIKKNTERHTDTLTSKRETYQSLNDRWNHHLSELSLRADTSPRTVSLVFAKVETVKSIIAVTRSLKQRITGMEKIISDYQDYLSKIPRLKEKVKNDPDKLLTAINNFIKELKEEDETRQKRELIIERLREKTISREKTEEKERVVKQTLNTAQNTFKERVQAWESWLDDYGLDHSVSPETALSALNTVNDCVRLIDARSDLEKSVDQKDSLIERYRNLVKTVFDGMNKNEPAGDRLVTEIRLLYQEYGDHKSNTTKKIDLEEQLADSSRELNVIQKELAKEKQKVDDLLKEANAEDRDDFKKRGDLHDRRNQILEAIDATKKNIKSISGERDLSSIREILAAETKENLEGKDRELQIEIDTTEQTLDTARQELADLKSKMDHLASSEEIAWLRSEEEILKEEILNEVRKWGVRAIARDLITKARETFEKEHQPRVIQDAIKYFKKFTDNAYSQIIAPLGERNIEVLTSENEKKKPDQLSRATAEQLYLSLRFGYMAKLASEGETLPIVMDDILVNFDANRSKYAAEAITELADNHQILFFTCHPETIEIFKNQKKGIPVYKLNAGGFLKMKL